VRNKKVKTLSMSVTVLIKVFKIY